MKKKNLFIGEIFGQEQTSYLPVTVVILDEKARRGPERVKMTLRETMNHWKIMLPALHPPPPPQMPQTKLLCASPWKRTALQARKPKIRWHPPLIFSGYNFIFPLLIFLWFHLAWLQCFQAPLFSYHTDSEYTIAWTTTTPAVPLFLSRPFSNAALHDHSMSEILLSTNTQQRSRQTLRACYTYNIWIIRRSQVQCNVSHTDDVIRCIKLLKQFQYLW